MHLELLVQEIQNIFLMEVSELVYTRMLGGGESDTITFDAPEPGTYIFICSFPGHYQLMMGEFIVS
jgi:azurin